MAGMGRAAWLAINSFTKEPRIDIMRKALGKTKIPVIDGTEPIFADIQENRDALEIFAAGDTTPFRLRTKAMRYVKSTNIAKSAIFGGGYGAGGPGNAVPATILTARFESLQCLYCAAMTNTPVKNFEEITEAMLKRAYLKNKKESIGKTKFVDAYALDVSWHKSSYFVAKRLIKEGYISSAYTFHRDDDIMNSIYDAKVRAFKNNEMANLNNDKWNPGDIWAIKSGVDVKKIFKDADTSVKKINSVIQQAFDNKTIIGISLKKVVKEEAMKSSVLNSDRMNKFAKSYELEGMKIAGAKSMFSAQGGRLSLSNNVEVDVRSGTFLGSLNMEILLKTARGGRAGQGPQLDAAKRFMNYTYPDNTKQKLESQAIANKDERAIDNFWMMVDTIQKSPLVKDQPIDEATFKAELNNQELKSIHVKLSVAYIFYGLVKASKQQRNDFVDYIANYAGSSLPESSVYLKVYQ